MIKQVRIEIVITLLVMLIAVVVITALVPNVKEVEVIKNVTIPCPELDCTTEVLQEKLNCLESKQFIEEVVIDDTICLEEETKPQWCPGLKCPSNQYCDIPRNAINGVCVDRECI